MYHGYQQQQPQQQSAFAPTDRGAILAGLQRRSGPPGQVPSSAGYATPPRQGMPMSAGYQQGYGGGGAGYQQQQQVDMVAMMEQLRLQNMAEQLEAMRLRTAEMTATFMAQQQAQQQAQYASAFSPPMPQQQSYSPQLMGGGAAAFRQQQQRGWIVSNDDMVHSSTPPQPVPRRSFGGATASVVERALARKAVSPPPMPTSAGTDGGFDQFQRGPGFVGGHRRAADSVGSSGSSVLSAGGMLTSPSGPSLVLSKPGESYPCVNSNSDSPTRAGHHVKRDSDATSSSSSGSGSESFDSAATSVGETSLAGKDKDGTLRHQASVPILNPSAPVFNPTAAVFTPAPALATPPMPLAGNGNGPRQRTPLALASRRTASGAMGRLGSAAIVIRQPRGAVPTDEPEFASLNFAGRIRKQGRAALGVLGRRIASPGFANTPSFEQQQMLATISAY